MLDKKIEYLDIVTQTLMDEELLGNTVLRQWQVITDLIKETRNLNLDKTILMNATENEMSKVTPSNFRKRISMLNQEFEENDLGINIENDKNNVIIVIVQEKLSANINQKTADFIKQSNVHNELNNDKFVAPKASPKLNETKRQVLFSYSWESDKDELTIQRKFADMLEIGLNNPPAKYKDSHRVSLFIDYKGFELGENQTEQQDTMCQITPVAVVCYTQKYLYSKACQREIDYYLSEEGRNIVNRRAIVVPFDCSYGDMDSRFQQNLALSPPNTFTNGLDFFDSASLADKKVFINQLVENIYDWFDKNPDPPKFDKHYDVKKTLRDTGNSVDLSSEKPEFLKGNTQQHQYEGAIDIVDYMYGWATGITGKETRLFYLLGDFGSGKSTSCQMLTKKLMSNYNQQKPENRPVLPIYLDLKKLLNAFGKQEDIVTQSVNNLLETMLSISGVNNNVSGDTIIQFIKEYPCLLIFDGFDEVGQKLNAKQQTGLLNKLIEIFPKSVYQQDLERLQVDGSLQEQTTVPINSRILISCRTHFFKSYAEQEAFHQLYYRNETSISAGETKNYQIYYLLPFTKEQIQGYLVNWLGKEDAEKAMTFINNVHDLSGLSERPLMLNLIRDLLPELQEEFKTNPHINASTLYKLLFDKVGYRDNEKHLIPLDEKRKLLGRFALYLWQQGVTTLYVEDLDNWILEHRDDYPQLNIKLNSGQYDPELILQDLHNASLLVRDNDDEYRFAHTSFLEFFVAVGIFDNVISSDNLEKGFDSIFTRENLSYEIAQFLIDWRLASREVEQIKFDQNWQLLQKAESSVSARQIAFDIWYFTYYKSQNFTTLESPNWQYLTFYKLEFNLHLESNPLDLKEINLLGANIKECDFSFVNFSNINLKNAYLGQNKFERCIAENVSCNQASSYENRFYHCKILKELQNKIIVSSNMIIPSSNISLSEPLPKYQQLINETIDASAFSLHPNGNQLLIGGSTGASIWEIGKSSIVCTHQFANGRNIKSCEFRSDGSQIIIMDYEEVLVYELNEEKIKILYTFRPETLVEKCRFSTDYSRILLDGRYGAYICEVKEEFTCVYKHDDIENVTNYEFSPDGSQIMLLNYEGFSIEDTEEDGNTYFQRFDKRHRVYECKFSPDGTQILLGGVNGASIWMIKDKSLVCTYQFPDKKVVRSVQFSPDSNLVLLGGINETSLWEMKNNKFICIHKFAKNQNITSCQFSCDATQIVLKSQFNEVSVWKINKERIDCTHQFNRKTHIQNCQFSPNGKNLLTGDYNGLSIWKVQRNELIRFKYLENLPFIRNCQFSPDSLKLVIIDIIGKASLWKIDGENVECIKEITTDKEVQSCEFSPDGSRLLLSSTNGASLWNIEDEAMVSLDSFADVQDIEHANFNSDGSQILLIGSIGASIWNVSEDVVNCIHRFDNKHFDKSSQFSPNRNHLLMVGIRGASLWELNSEKITLLHQFAAEQNIRSCHFNRDGTKLFSGGSEGVSIWSVRKKAINFVDRFAKNLNVSIIDYSPDLSLIAVVSSDHTYVYHLNNDSVELKNIIQLFDDSVINYTDSSFTSIDSIQGKAWKYLYNKVTCIDGSIEILPPDTHPDWDRAYKG
ncbi:hypothetical protein [uncultured Psychrobacter sp.]|uniref:NACHT and WD40 repeat domain-containing protein n=1 Tax=uncultured Psychrobacter sp. TaxID=259303 RepID=UPI003457612F